MISVVENKAPLHFSENASDDKKQHAEAAAIALELLVNRLSSGDKFSKEFATNPIATLATAGIVLQKEGLEFLMDINPDRFDRLTDALFDLMDPALLNSIVGPSCDMPQQQ
ncbi:hypothetical protein [Chromobacterium amazonense]|uniref:Uncharacterized protein n=1 Tax=Chromobacterium amazonense TaxID=1382803 RepID=A0ABU8V340_9NEIS|nr:hypothetical protein [Chromobacterium amazonense]MDQ4540680.1 hypothetical protein [Chromobacterium amazonense]